MEVSKLKLLDPLTITVVRSAYNLKVAELKASLGLALQPLVEVLNMKYSNKL